MYENFYKLAAKPFQLSPDSRFFYGSRGHKRAMAYLRYGLAQSEGFIVVTGDIGTGKSTLVQALLNDLAKSNVIAAQLVTTQLDPEDTLRMVVAAFGLPYDGMAKATLLKNLEGLFLQALREGKRALLIVDEAQNLPLRSIEELRMLSNFTVAGRPMLQTFLLGQHEFRRILQSEGMEQLRQRVIAAYHLSGLDADETRAYIEHRLKRVGWNQDPSFSAEVFAEIHQYTRGVPRRINTFCDRLLLFSFLEECHEINVQTVRTVIEELRGETVTTPPCATTTAPTITPEVASAPSNDSEYRFVILEKRVEALENTLRMERALGRRPNTTTEEGLG